MLTAEAFKRSEQPSVGNFIKQKMNSVRNISLCGQLANGRIANILLYLPDTPHIDLRSSPVQSRSEREHETQMVQSITYVTASKIFHHCDFTFKTIRVLCLKAERIYQKRVGSAYYLVKSNQTWKDRYEGRNAG